MRSVEENGPRLERFLFAHLSDPHLTSPAPPAWREFVSKRGFGYRSWRRRTGAKASPRALQRVSEDLDAFETDHVAITGDLTNLGSAAEYRESAQWLSSLGSEDDISVVPGNHDCCVPAAWEETVGQWERWMVSGAGLFTGFPFVRCRGPVAFIGVNAAVPTGIGLATGRLGNDQTARLGAILDWASHAGYFRVLLIHHPPLPGLVAWRKRLVDATSLRRLLAVNGADLILHGHAHCFHFGWLPGPRGGIPVLGAPGASDRAYREWQRAGYYRCTLTADGAHWDLHVARRALDTSEARLTDWGQWRWRIAA